MATNYINEITLKDLNRMADDAPKKWREIIVHHFYSPSAAQYKGKSTWDAVRNYHVNSRGWSDIGYHVGVGPDGSLWILRHSDSGGYRGPLAAFGSHCIDHNAAGLGVVLAINGDVEDPKKYGWNKLVEAVALLADAFDIPVEKIYPHRKFANKTCPGKKFDFDEFQKAVANEIGGTAPGGGNDIPALPENAVVLGSSYVTTDVIWKNDHGYVPIAEICNGLGWDVTFKKTPDGNRWYVKNREWK